MPTDEFDDSDDTPDDGTEQVVRIPRKDIRALEAKGKKADEAEARASAAERELVFVKAGVDTASAFGQLFAKGYDGELNVDAVKAALAEVAPTSSAPTAATSDDSAGGDASSTPTPSDQNLEPGETELTEERSRLAATPGRDTGLDEDPRDSALAVGDRILADGGKREEAMGGMLNHLVNAAHRGDRRVIIDSRSAAARGG